MDFRDAVIEQTAKLILRGRLVGNEDDPGFVRSQLEGVSARLEEMPANTTLEQLEQDSFKMANQVQDTDPNWEIWCYLGI